MNKDIRIETRQYDNRLAVLNYDADLCGNIEQALKGLQGYGIMALELIQNADDAGAKKLVFDITPKGLIVWNSAEFTTCGLEDRKCPWEYQGGPDGLKRPCNFHAISRMGGRSKIHAEKQIGRFGIGFVSVYQITDRPIIRSAGMQIVLDPLTREVPATRVARSDGTEFELEWASTKSEMRAAIHASPTPDGVERIVSSEIQKVLRSSLLFLRNLKRVEVREAGKLSVRVEIEREADELVLTYTPDGRAERWLVLSRSAGDLIAERNLLANFEILVELNRSIDVSVAIPLHGTPTEGLLFAYLPTQHKTGMPVHINADFFPHASRQEIVLRGESHERHWNETLIAAAAAIIGENLALLRDSLGHVRLWQVGADAFKLRDGEAFGVFWKQFSAAAAATNSVWTTNATWQVPGATYMASEGLNASELSALSSLAFDLLHPDLRQYWTPLSTIGVKDLRLQTVAAKLLQRNGSDIAAANPHLRPLWAAIAKLIESEGTRRDSQAAVSLGLLGTTKFLIDIYGNVATPKQLWRTSGISAAEITRFIPGCPLVDEDVLSHPQLANLVDVYRLDDFARGLAGSIRSAEDAAEVIGTDPAEVRSLYELMIKFGSTREETTVASILARTPFLRTKEGFVAPQNAQLPGGFEDPMGKFEFLDTSVFPPGAEEILEHVLEVNRLSFHEYIDEHLEEILELQPTREQYMALLSIVAAKRHELDAKGSLAILADRAFVRTKAGRFARPRECYYWSASLELIFGKDDGKWVDEAWMPRGYAAAIMRDIFESDLGMPTSASAQHIVDRIQELAEFGSPETIDRPLTLTMRHLIEHWPRYTTQDREVLGALKDTKFLPATINEARDEEALYPPSQVYRATRYKGFESQVPVVALMPLRGGASNDILNFLGLPSEPPTRTIVAHLEHCIDTESEPNDLTYAMLHERFERGDDPSSIDTLQGRPFIYNSERRQFLRADQVFWQHAPVAGRWWSASASMWQRQSLYSHLGVRNAPEPSDYASLMLEAALEGDADARLVYEHCMVHLCRALEGGSEEAIDAVLLLVDQRSLINRSGEPIYPADAIWIDSSQLADPFGADLDECLVPQPSVDRTTSAKFFRLLKVPPISQVARRLIAVEPDRDLDETATTRLRELRDLVLWLVPSRSRAELREILSHIRILVSRSVTIRTEIPVTVPVQSPPVSAPAFLEGYDLHVEAASFSRGWFAIFKELFYPIDQEGLLDIAPLVGTACLIMQSRTAEDAALMLRDLGFSPPGETTPIALNPGKVLGDLPEGADEEFGEAAGDRHQESSLDAEPFDQTAVISDESEIASDGLDEAAEGTSVDPSERKDIPQTTNAVQLDADDDRYRSKPASGNDFGAEAVGGGADEAEDPGGLEGTGGRKSLHGNNQGSTPLTVSSRTRSSRLLSYVTRATDREGGEADGRRSEADIAMLIDVGAIQAALRYEAENGRKAEEQPHINPGFDIVSTAPDGSRRIIEVKGLDGEWTDRGTKLSRTQYRTAEQHQDEYWLYVVEHARDRLRQRLHAIRNPFQQVDEYWFDRNWRDAAEERLQLRDINLQVGTRVKHVIWGEGTVVSTKRIGIALEVIVDYGDRKAVTPVTSDLAVID